MVVLTGVTAWRRWNEPRTAGSSRPPARPGVARASLMTAAVLFVPWALWWGTLRP
ncbi:MULTISPECIES: hypothetical protein [Streptomyces]|uniref:Uncharacterized protein n=1 Tax=Streptomyces bugieae TaxID=3098223 RepID=A0ABU7NTD0_9ACTN|nr:hypothetical protein [Streptomyces nigrescens]MEE4422138.1 hypothetical protein [Streptomyces sp. DSM 41528]